MDVAYERATTGLQAGNLLQRNGTSHSDENWSLLRMYF